MSVARHGFYLIQHWLEEMQSVNVSADCGAIDVGSVAFFFCLS